ncbi:MAG: TRAP transporter small permease [Magnetococcales bacterium]|nr:TRAP transporter small permease [Magnetococcales bacterium]
MSRLLDHLEEWLIILLMGSSTVIVFVAVVHRYALGIPWLFEPMSHFSTSWAQEVCIYLFIWMAKFGAAYGVRTGIHVGVDVVVKGLREDLRHKVILFGLLSGAVFTAIIGSLGAHFVWAISRTEQTSPDLELPMWLVYLCIPLGSSLMCWRFLQVAWGFYHTRTLPRHDHLPLGNPYENEEPHPS